MTRISVITPSLNQGRFIVRTIGSVLSQGIPKLNYVVVDGGSTDGTVEILKRYGEQISWVSEADRGQAHAVNKGIGMTSGDIIGWLNSDDVYYPNAIATVQDFFDANPYVDLVYGDAYHIDSEDKVIEPYYTEPWDSSLLQDVCYLCQPAVFFRRRVVDRIGPLDEGLKYCMDYEYWLRAAQRGAKFSHMRQVLAGSRLHPETKTLSSRKDVLKEINNMTRVRLGRVPDRWLFNYADDVVERRGLRPSQRLRFALTASAVSVGAALRWNHGVSMEMLNRVIRTVAGNMRLTFTEVFSR